MITCIGRVGLWDRGIVESGLVCPRGQLEQTGSGNSRTGFDMRSVAGKKYPTFYDYNYGNSKYMMTVCKLRTAKATVDVIL